MARIMGKATLTVGGKEIGEVECVSIADTESKARKAIECPFCVIDLVPTTYSITIPGEPPQFYVNTDVLERKSLR